MQENKRAKLAARTTAATLRPLTRVIPSNKFGVLATRAIIASSLAAFGPTLPGTGIRAIDVRIGTGRIRGEWICSARTVRKGAVILYLHGSAYVACSPKTHRGLTSRLSADTQLPVFVCRYRRAPRHCFPTAANDALAAYKWLLSQGYEKVIVVGDSAGGHMAVDLALGLARAGEPGPKALVLFSPLYDLTFALSEAQERIRRDPMVSAKQARQLVEHYTRGVDPAHERLSLSVRNAPPLPPMLIQAGGAEMLSADARQLARDAAAAGGSCVLEIWPHQMHVFQALPVLIPEARPALRVAANFIDNILCPDHSVGTNAAAANDVPASEVLTKKREMAS